MKRRHLAFLADQRVQHAALLVSGMPELEGRPFRHWLSCQLGKIWSFFRYGIEHFLAALSFFLPWLWKAASSTTYQMKRDVRRGYRIFPVEFWLSICLIIATGLILSW